MSQPTITLENPHDKFFKETFSRIDILTDFLQAYLPADLYQLIDGQSIRQETDSYVDDALQEHFADLVFSVELAGQPVTLMLLLEHKSYIEDYPQIQLNQYILNVWQSQLKQKKALTPVLPVVIYHGNRRWKKRSVPAWFGPLPATLLPFLPQFDYVLINLSQPGEGNFPQLRTEYARLVALVLRHNRRQRELLRVLETFAEQMSQWLTDSQGRSLVQATLVYTYFTTDLSRELIVAIFTSVANKTENVAMSTGERLILEGLEKGLEKGLEQGQQLTAKKYVRGMLKIGMDATTIAAVTDMTVRQVETLIAEVRAEDGQ
jgi:predicted transposase/invertase (TIGR01784 family)